MLGKPLIELANAEVYYEYCALNVATNEITFLRTSEVSGLGGLYFRDYRTFFALYATSEGPTIYYGGKEYRITPNLNISLVKNGGNCRFFIEDFKVVVDYAESPFIGLDGWSYEIDVDLFIRIKQQYKEQSFYERYTLGS